MLYSLQKLSQDVTADMKLPPYGKIIVFVPNRSFASCAGGTGSHSNADDDTCTLRRFLFWPPINVLMKAAKMN